MDLVCRVIEYFLKLAGFTLLFFAPVVGALILSSVIWVNSEPSLVLQWDSEGFNNFLNIFKLPIGVLATIIPAVALVTANHRSMQSAANLKAQQAQNNFANYYTHIEKFEQFIRSRDSSTNKAIFIDTRYFSPRYLHGQMYPKLKTGDLEISDELSQEVEIACQHVAAFSAVIDTYKEIKVHDLSLPREGVELVQQLAKDDAQVVSDLIGSLYWIYEICNSDPMPVDSNLQTLIKRTGNTARYLARVCEFDSDITSSNLAGHLIGLENYCVSLQSNFGNGGLALNASFEEIFTIDELSSLERPGNAWVRGT